MKENIKLRCEYESGLVSVIIPTYKRTDTLNRAIDSVLKQTYSKLEVLVVDDNIPDDEISQNVKRIIAKYNNQKVRLIRQERHINGAAARNAGIRASNAEYIAFLDDDDFFLKDKLRCQIECLNKLDDMYGAVASRVYYMKNGQIIRNSSVQSEGEQCIKILERRLMFPTPTLLFRHQALDSTGYFDESLKRHQEIQLLSYFSEKYQIKPMKETLTVVTLDDLKNRPDLDALILFKEQFFRSVSPVLEKFSEKQVKDIRSIHNFEIALVCVRTKKFKMAIHYFFKDITVKAFFFLCIRIVKRMQENITWKIKGRDKYPQVKDLQYDK